MDAPLAKSISSLSGRLDRIIYVFVCNSRLCTESGKGGAVKAIVHCKRLPQCGKGGLAGNAEFEASTPKGLWDSLMGDVTQAVEKTTIADDKESETQAIFDKTYPVAFPATALRIEEEFIAIHKRKAKDADIAKVEEISAGAPDEVWQGEAYEKMEVAGYDKVFKAFHSRVSHYPRQCVRYSPGGTPLLFHVTPDGQVPSSGDCAACGNPRHLELQLMPAILSLLPTNDPKHLQHIPKSKRGKHPLFGDGMEWGTIMVYSCGTCSLSPTSSFDEIAFVAGTIVQIEQI